MNAEAVLNFVAASGNLRSGVLSPDMERASQRLSQADFDDYKRRLGEKSPTPSDAMIFSKLSMKLSKKLPSPVMKKYNDAVLIFKKKKTNNDVDAIAAAASTIAEIESQALSEDPKVVTKLVVKRNLFHNNGQRV